MTSTEDAKYCLRKIVSALVGGKIIALIETEDDDYGYGYGFRVKALDNVTFDCYIDCDPEGNGPGFLSIEATQNG